MKPREFKVVIDKASGVPCLVAPATMPDKYLVAFDRVREKVLLVREVVKRKAARR